MKRKSIPDFQLTPPPPAKTKKRRPAPGLFINEPLEIDDNPFGKRTSVGLMTLDIATHTGFCTHTASGVWNLTPKKDESKGMRLIRFKAKLREVCELEQIKQIAFEQIPMYGKYPNTVGLEMIGVLKLFCEESGIEYSAYPVKNIKQFATGRGGASKEQMVEAAKKYNPSVDNDDEADAILLYHLVLKDLQLS